MLCLLQFLFLFVSFLPHLPNAYKLSLYFCCFCSMLQFFPMNSQVMASVFPVDWASFENILLLTPRFYVQLLVRKALDLWCSNQSIHLLIAQMTFQSFLGQQLAYSTRGTVLYLNVKSWLGWSLSLLAVAFVCERSQVESPASAVFKGSFASRTERDFSVKFLLLPVRYRWAIVLT